MLSLLMVVCVLLLYGSLYPWQFHTGPSLTGAFRHVFSAWPARFGLGELKDIIVNLVVYTPVGFLGYLSQSHGFRLWRAVWPVGLGFLLSLSVETLQHYCDRRVPSLVDVICNTVGALAGVMVASAFEATLRSHWHGLRTGRTLRPSSALLMLMLWAVYHTLPLRPIPSGFISKLKILVAGTEWSWLEFTGALIIWLTIGQLIRAIAAPSLVRRLLVLGGPAVLLARVVAPGRTFTWDEATGIGSGLLLSLAFGSQLQSRRIVLAVMWVVWLIANELRPFEFIAKAQPINWVPFLDLLHSEWVEAVLTVLRKGCLYGTAFWCVEQTGIRPTRAMLWLAGLIAALEALQVWVPGRVASTTDIALMLLMGALLCRLERKYSGVFA